MAGNPQAASNPLSTRSAYSQVSNVDNNNGSFDWHHQAAVIICTLVVAAVAIAIILTRTGMAFSRRVRIHFPRSASIRSTTTGVSGSPSAHFRRRKLADLFHWLRRSHVNVNQADHVDAPVRSNETLPLYDPNRPPSYHEETSQIQTPLSAMVATIRSPLRAFYRSPRVTNTETVYNYPLIRVLHTSRVSHHSVPPAEPMPIPTPLVAHLPSDSPPDYDHIIASSPNQGPPLRLEEDAWRARIRNFE